MRPVKQVYQFVVYSLRTKLTRVQYIMLVATLTGLFSGLAAVLLKTLVHYLQDWIKHIDVSRFSYLLFPVIGLLLTVLVIKLFFHSHIEKGIAMVLRSIARKSSFIPLKHTYLHIVTSSLTVGLGGSAGLEAPIVATGSAIGSNTARISDLNYRERSLLIGCGAAAGIAAVFNAPIAGVIFAIEVLLTEAIVVSYFIPLIISSVVGALCSKIILQESFLFNFVLKSTFDYRNVPFYVLLGVLAGFVSRYYARTFKGTETRLHHWKLNAYGKAIIGGTMLMALYFIFPPLFGEGYESITSLANGTPGEINDNTAVFSLLNEDWSLVIFTGLIVLLKPLSAAITIGSGGNGGNFAPSLFTGSYLGFFFSKLLNITGWVKIPEGNFSLVGMAGVLSGVMYCPLSAIFLIAEITNGYELFIPLMIVSAISFFIVKSYDPYSMETRQLAKEGQIFTHKKEKNILTSIQLTDMLQDRYDNISIDQNLRALVDIIKKSERNIFAVHDQKGKFAGIIELNDIKQLLFQPELFDKTPLRKLVKKPADTIGEDQDMHIVMEKFDITQSWYLPVLDKERNFLGFISKSKLFSKYREILDSQGDLYDAEH
ncbi:chloride channel protein [Terrimonas sp. NA20]|uniref:Chloride channel protein n=1 Tax=Terrimonas ginsenosidimutans TaxID=2908004 RepID=A0ABS9KL34_9BACT|nr:chloride channel protein [Terrimonas ginsenosidimutans]MCG2613016.1 chloride channel protein [Terrimonas ginsenosidimutans]